MAVHAHSTGAPTRASRSRIDSSPAAIMARTDAFAADHVARLATRPKPVADPRSAADLLAEIRTIIEGQTAHAR